MFNTMLFLASIAYFAIKIKSCSNILQPYFCWQAVGPLRKSLPQAFRKKTSISLLPLAKTSTNTQLAAG